METVFFPHRKNTIKIEVVMKKIVLLPPFLSLGKGEG
jgi:hypothetical protein